MKIQLTTTNQVKSGKTVYKDEKKEVREIDEKIYNNITSDETIKFFRRIGGTETVTRSYTCKGYKIVKIVSTSPDKQKRTIRVFDFID